MERKVLLLGCGSTKDIRTVTPLANVAPEITTLDLEAAHKPDVVWDLNVCPWPFADNSFDEVHAYEVLEHLGTQGDAKAFFDHFGEIYRILKPMGYVGGSVPRWDHMWALGDPSHRRVISEGTLFFLDQNAYLNVGKTMMTDFRSIWKGDFSTEATQKTDGQLYFLLKAHKPARA